jgi:hypothetical protein
MWEREMRKGEKSKREVKLRGKGQEKETKKKNLKRSRVLSGFAAEVGNVPVLTSGVGSVPVLTLVVGSVPVLTLVVGSVPVLTSGVGRGPVLSSAVGKRPEEKKGGGRGHEL